MTPPNKRQALTWTELLLAIPPYLVLLGLLSLAASLLLAFERPHRGTFIVPILLIISAPVAMLIHLAATTEMTMEDKGRWIRAMGKGDAGLFAAYFSRKERRAVTQRLAGLAKDVGPEGDSQP